MNISHIFSSLQFDNDGIFNKQIQPMRTDFQPAISYFYLFLSFELEPIHLQFDQQCLFIYTFQKTWAECAVYINCACNDVLTQFLELVFLPACSIAQEVSVLKAILPDHLSVYPFSNSFVFSCFRD